VYPLNFFGQDQRADFRIFIQRIANGEFGGQLTKLSTETFSNVLMYKYFLYRYAYLSGMVEASFDQGGNGCLQVCIPFHDHRRHTSMLQRTSGAGRQVAP